ncbi:MAG TPA: XrtB/PEP-CTERM-associated transcriptional regulator EpsA [Ramlibacter sp.]|nr:XrtB/PEP-CTERM-associated transcriptional regulator EpsA [Ramlibacter sp.]
MSTLVPAPELDPADFLRIASQGAALATHAGLWRWLQGDVQRWLPHDAMLVGWGDFRSGQLHCDVISSLPGLRTAAFGEGQLSGLLSYFRDCWVGAQSQPCQLDIAGSAEREIEGVGWVAAESIARMGCALVHGIGDGRLSRERIFVALSTGPARPGAAGVLKLLVPVIDTVLRQVPAAPQRDKRCERRPIETLVVRLGALSERERQIMVWVAMGKTNPEIGCILCISEFTVKNHLKSIFSKLDVSNRAQAVARLTQMGGTAYA